MSDWRWRPTRPEPGDELSPLVRYARTISAVDKNAVYDMAHYRWANDSGTESSPSWAQAEDTDDSVTTGSNWTRILRFRIAQTDNQADLLRSPSLKIVAQLNGTGGYLDLGAGGLGSRLTVHNSTVLTHGSDCTNTLTDVYTSKYIPDDVGTSNSGQIDNANTEMNAALNIATQNDNSEWEIAIALTFNQTNFSDGDTLDFRPVHGASSDQSENTALNAYTANSSQGYARMTYNAPVTNSYSTDFWEEMTNVPDTISGTTPTAIDSMSITPGAGTYLVLFNGAVAVDSGSEVLTAALYANGSEVADSGPINFTRTQMGAESDFDNPDRNQLVCAAEVTVGASQAIAAYWWSSSSSTTWTIHHRRLILVQVSGSAAIDHAGANSASTSSTDYSASACSISAPPGDAGDYLVVFKCTVIHESSGSLATQFRLYVGGTAVGSDHFRNVEHSSYFPNIEFPHFQACIVNVGASDAVDMRYARVGGTTETVSIEDIGMVVYGPFAAADWDQDSGGDNTSQASSTSYVAIDRDSGDGGADMSVSLSTADDYIAMFSETMDLSAAPSASDNKMQLAFFVNASEDASTQSAGFFEETLVNNGISQWAFGQISPGSSQTVDIRLKNIDQTGYNWIHEPRTLLMFRPSSYTAGAFQPAWTVNSNMTIHPGNYT